MSGAIVATTLYPKAAPTPSAISVNMLSERLTIDAQPRCEEGARAPDHHRRGERQLDPDAQAVTGQRRERIGRQQLRRHERQDRRRQ